MPALVSIAEAARQLGVSPDTVKRRIRAGELVALREPRPQGFRWLVELGDGVAAGVPPDSLHPSAPVDTTALAVAQAEVRRLEETVAILRHELESRRNEAAALQMLLRETRPHPGCQRYACLCAHRGRHGRSTSVRTTGGRTGAGVPLAAALVATVGAAPARVATEEGQRLLG